MGHSAASAIAPPPPTYTPHAYRDSTPNTRRGSCHWALRERSGNVQAYLAYLMGTALLSRYTVAGSDAAVTESERATLQITLIYLAAILIFKVRIEGSWPVSSPWLTQPSSERD